MNAQRQVKHEAGMSAEFNKPVPMVSLRTFRLATLNGGHIISFKAREATMVPHAAVAEAMAKGCAPVDEELAPFLEDMSRAKTEFAGDLRRSVILLTIDVLVRDNNAKNFDGAGLPRLAVVNERVGFDVTKQELLALFREYQGMRNSNTELQIHPQAKLVQQIVDATDRKELAALLPDLNISRDLADGVTLRDLRKLMLSKLTGLSAG